MTKLDEMNLRTSTGPGLSLVLSLPGIVLIALSFRFAPLALFGSFFLVASVLRALHSTSCVIDRSTSTLTLRSRVMGFPRERTVSLVGIHCVRLSRELRGGGNSRRQVFAVRLVGAEPPGILLLERGAYRDARVTAESVGRFLHVDMRDNTSGVTVLREAGTLDETARDRVRRVWRTPTLPARPASCRVVRSVHTGGGWLRLPAPGLRDRWVVLGTFGMLLFVPGLAAATARDLSGTAAAVELTLVGLAALAIVAVTLRATLGRDTVEVTATKLVLRRWGLWPLRATIPLTELEELTLVPLKGTPSAFTPRGFVLARSDRATVRLGRNLTMEESRYLRDSIAFLISASPEATDAADPSAARPPLRSPPSPPPDPASPG